MIKAILTIALVASSAMCWWENGHYLVARIAQTELETNYPEVFEKANNLIKSMEGLADGNDLFITSSVWADQIKSQLKSLNSWHRYHLPYNPDPIYLQQNRERKFSNVVDSLERSFEALSDEPEKANFQKAFFLRFAIHNIGDVHQPLHAMTFYNSTHNSEFGDDGGNDQNILTPRGEEMELHDYWDSGCQYLHPPPLQPWSGFKFPMNETEQARMKKWGLDLVGQYPKEFFGKKQILNLDYMEWVKESRLSGIKTTYPLILESNQITEEYEEMAHELIRQRVVLAGYRLANFLKSSISGSELDLGDVPEMPKLKEEVQKSGNVTIEASSGCLLLFNLFAVLAVLVVVL